MAIAWFCSCGMAFHTEPESSGTEVVCSWCGKSNRAPGPDNSPQVKVTSRPPLPAPREEDVPEVVPIEEEIPEVDVDVEEPEETFATRHAAAGNHAWANIGAVDLINTADCVALGPGGAYGLAGQDDEVLVLNMHKGSKLDRFGGHEALVTSLAISPTGDAAVSGDEDGDVFYWEVSTRQRVRRFRAHDCAVSATAIAPDLDRIATGDRDGLIRLWNVRKNEEERLRDTHWSEKIVAFAFSADSGAFAAAGSKGYLGVWSLRTGKLVQRFRMTAAASSLQFQVRTDAVLAVLKPKGSKPAHPEVWRLDPKTAEAREMFRPADAATIVPYRTLLTVGGRRLICVGHDERDRSVVEVWHVANQQWLHRFDGLRADVTGLAVAPNHTRLLLADDRRRVHLFALAEREVG